MPNVADKLPDFNRGFIREGTCAQAVLALLTIVERELRERSEIWVAFVDIKKCSRRVRRELFRPVSGGYAPAGE